MLCLMQYLNLSKGEKEQPLSSAFFFNFFFFLKRFVSGRDCLSLRITPGEVGSYQPHILTGCLPSMSLMLMSAS